MTTRVITTPPPKKRGEKKKIETETETEKEGERQKDRMIITNQGEVISSFVHTCYSVPSRISNRLLWGRPRAS